MLTQLISLLEKNKDGLSLFDISRMMKSQPSAVMSMLELLVQKGKLLAIGPDGKYCADCGQVSDCNLLAVHGKRYVLSSQFTTQVE
ncbi:MAG: FeoC-like transcriptional regulator [Anaerolineales bacterium]